MWYNRVTLNTDSFKKLNDFFLKQKPIHYRKRETILFTKDVPPGVFYITSGYVRSYLLSKEGKELTVTLFKPFDMFPMQWVINDVLTSHYYESLTEVTICRAPKQEFLQLLKHNSDVFFYTTSNILTRLNSVSERMEASILGNAYQKVSGIIAFLVDQLRAEQENQIKICIPFTHKDIASLTGLTRETVSLEMERLEKEHIIALQNHLIVIENMEELQKIAATV